MLNLGSMLLSFSTFQCFSAFSQFNIWTTQLQNLFICLFGVSSSKICGCFLLFNYIWLNISVPFIALISSSGLLHIFLYCFMLFISAVFDYTVLPDCLFFSIDCFIWDKKYSYASNPALNVLVCVCFNQFVFFASAHTWYLRVSLHSSHLVVS